MKYTITGVLTTTSPLHIASPAPARATMDGRVHDYFEKGSSTPCIRVRRQPFSTGAFPLERLTQEEEEAEASIAARGAEKAQRPAWEDVPVIPANSLRGRLRRFAARAYYDALLEKGEMLSLRSYNVMQCGAATGNPDGSDSTFDDLLAGREHPYFGLFGGGARMRKSGLRVDEAYAVTELTADFVPYVPATYVTQRGWLMTSVLFKRRNDDILSLADPAYQTRILGENHRQVIGGYMDEVFDSKERKKAKAKATEAAGGDAEQAGSDKERGVQSFHAIEVVNPGSHFALRFEIDGHAGHLGLLLVALQGLFRDQRLGGCGQLGFGRFNVPVLTIQREGAVPQPVFAPPMEGGGLFELAENDVVLEALDCWNVARDGASAAQIEALAGFAR